MKKILKSSIVLGGLMVLVLSYQNCSGTGEFGSFVKKSDRDAFGFPVKVDAGYMGFMSCAGVEQVDFHKNQGFYTVRAATDSFRGEGGIGLDKTFIEQVLFEKQKRPANFILKDEIARALDENSKINDAKLHFSVAFTERLQDVVLDTSTDFYSSSIYDSINFSSSILRSELAAKTDESVVLGRDFLMDIDWRYLTQESYNDWVDALDSQYSIGLGFTSENTKRSFQEANRSPAEFDNKDGSGMYGRALQVNFEKNTFYNLREEEGLATQGFNAVVDKNWVCQSLTIVRPTPTDVEEARVHPSKKGSASRAVKCLGNGESFEPLQNVATDLQNDNFDRALDKLLGSDWAINPKKDCIIHRSYIDTPQTPKRGCYAGNSATTDVLYGDFTASQGQQNPITGNAYINPHYATICYAAY